MTVHNKNFPIAPEFVFDNLDSMQAIRKTLKISQKELADATHIAHSMINSYEQGTHFPVKEKYNELAKFFDWEIWE